MLPQKTSDRIREMGRNGAPLGLEAMAYERIADYHAEEGC